MIEILAVLGVVAILMAVIIPIAQGARRQYAIVETKARFQRYTLALEQFKAELGTYPAWGSSPVAINQPPGSFVQLLTGHAVDGSAMTDSFALSQNPKKLSFIQFSSNEITTDGQLQDAFGQTDITLYVDTDGDGFLNGIDNIRGSLGWQSTGSSGTFHSW